MRAEVRDATAADAGPIAAIYNHFIVETTITFELEPVDAAELERRIEAIGAAGLPWLVAVEPASARAGESERVLGYAYAAPWRARRAYQDSVEVSVYLDPAETGRGLGTRLYATLFERLRALGKHIAIAGVTLPNAASVRLHERFGMEKVAHFREVGFKFGRRLDVGYWQVTLSSARETTRESA